MSSTMNESNSTKPKPTRNSFPTLFSPPTHPTNATANNPINTNIALTNNTNNLNPSTNSSSITNNTKNHTPGWNIGLTHSGSYLSTPTRYGSSTFQIKGEETTSFFDSLKQILWRKKKREVDVLKVAEEKLKKKKQQEEEELNSKKMSGKRKGGANRSDGSGHSETDAARQAALAKTTTLRNQLNELALIQAQITSEIQASWKKKIEEYEEKSLKEEEDTLKKMREEHKKEIDKMKEEGELEEKKLKSKKRKLSISKLIGENNESLNHAGGGEQPRKNKKLKVGGSANSEDKETEGGGDNHSQSQQPSSAKDGDSKKNNASGDTTSETKDSSKLSKEHEPSSSSLSETTKENSNSNSNDEEALDIKKKELESIVNEMNDLNKTKSQMIWLLKQVITAETKLKIMKKKKP